VHLICARERTQLYFWSAPASRNSWCPSARRGPLPVLGSHGSTTTSSSRSPTARAIRSEGAPLFLPAHAALSTSAFTASTLSLRHHHRHHRHRGLRASVGAVTLSVIATSPPPTLPSWPPPPPSPPMWLSPGKVPLPPSPPPPPPSPTPLPPVHHPLRFAALTHHCPRLLQP